MKKLILFVTLVAVIAIMPSSPNVQAKGVAAGGSYHFSFKGFTCTEPTCAAHREGYKWAMQKHVRYTKSCTKKSQSFYEGCQAWIRYDRGEKEYAPKRS